MMPRRLLLFALPLLFGIGAAHAQDRPVLVELFTSQGCSSCPPADAQLGELAHRPDILALAFHVDYWDRLGWKDPFSSPAATARQRRYAKELGLFGVYTPQIVVDGRFEAVGSDRAAVAALIEKARRHPPNLAVTLAALRGKAHIAIGDAPDVKAASVALVGYDLRHVTKIGGGENGGRELVDVDAVRGIEAVGSYAGRPVTIEAAIPWQSDRLAVIVEADDGEVLGIARTE